MTTNEKRSRGAPPPPTVGTADHTRSNSRTRRRRSQPLPTADMLLRELEAAVIREWGDLADYAFCPDFPSTLTDRSGGEAAHGPERRALAVVLYARFLRERQADHLREFDRFLRERESKQRRASMRLVAGG